MGTINIDADLLAGSHLAAGLSASYVISGALLPGAVVTPHLTTALYGGPVAFVGASDLTLGLTGAYPLTSLPIASASVSGSLIDLLSASVVAGSTLTATTLEEDMTASLAGSSSVSPDATVALLVTSTADSRAHLGANLNGSFALAATPTGGSSLAAYWGQFLSGEADGVVTVTGTPGLLFKVSGETGGEGALSASNLTQTILFSGTASGVGTLTDNSVITLTGTASGVATLSAFLHAELLFYGLASGTSNLFDTTPQPIIGVGDLFGFLDVERVPPPVNCPPWAHQDHEDCHHGVNRPDPRRPHFDRKGFQHPFPFPGPDERRAIDKLFPCAKQFRLGHIFTLGDLQVTLTDSTGTQYVSPVNVMYVMYMVTSTGFPMQVGPIKPAVKQKNGQFYVVGTAGEGGQPGNWLVRWAYQATFGGDYVTVDQPFKVVDAISAPIVGDPTCRKTKYGWD